MTIKLRNRIAFIFFIICSIVVFSEYVFLLYRFITKSFAYPSVSVNIKEGAFFLFSFNKRAVFLSIIFLGLYVSLTSISLVRFFLKTQAPDIIFFLLFLLAILCDTVRITLTLYQNVGFYSNYNWLVGNITLFSRILAPLGLTACVTLTNTEARQNLERNSLIIIMVAAFLANLIPLNTTLIKPNLIISYSLNKTIKIASICILLLSIFTLIIQKIQQESSQWISVGFTCICVGYNVLFECINYFSLILGIVFLVLGTVVYFKSMHDEYMWLN